MKIDHWALLRNLDLPVERQDTTAALTCAGISTGNYYRGTHNCERADGNFGRGAVSPVRLVTETEKIELALCPHHQTVFVKVLRSLIREVAITAAKAAYDEALAAERSRSVYYLRRSDGAIKIGVSGVLPERMRTLEKEHGPLELLASHPGGRASEALHHSLFAEYRLEGEWSAPAPPLLDHISTIAAELEQGNAS